ncbi:MAG TPA: beta-propeller domain-containing protein [Nocardioidaceae bacterium]|nr:beta-propeller domain-containing protein [Nocardioidaceae bacterium]
MHRPSRRITALGATAAGLVAAGAVTVIGAGPGATPTAVADELTPFDDCAQLRSWYVESALPHVTAWGWDTGGPIVFDGVMPLASTPRVAAPPAAAAETGAVGNGATGTNLQEQDVDEPDLAKTDGENVVVIRHGDLVVYDATGEQAHEIGRLDLPWRLQIDELLLVGDRAVLFGSTTAMTPYIEPPGPIRRALPYGEPTTERMITSGPHTTITTVDLTDPAAPTVQRTETVQGDLVSAREHDGTVRVVTTWLPSLDFAQPYPRLTSKQALAKNRDLVRSTTAADWLPSTRVDGGSAQPLMSCADVRHPDDPAGAGTISVVTMAPDDPVARTGTGVAADGDLTYSSADRLYVATADDGWTWTADQTRDTTTDIHAFDVAGDQTTYVASGEVPGRVKDQWSFSEDGGLLRVASTLGPSWAPKETKVTVLAERDGRLDPIGSVGGIGPEDQIEAVRWFGDVAVVVTFRLVDPLYTLDLSDPRHPTVVGELKIPGFSAYLHPLGDDLLLGVGQDATRAGSLRGSQVSTFNLGDLADPRRLDQLGLGYTRSSAIESDSRAFSYLPGDRLAFVPTTSWRFGGAMDVIRIDPDGVLALVKRIELPGWSSNARALPLADGRVAVVGAGDQVQLVDPAGW